MIFILLCPSFHKLNMPKILKGLSIHRLMFQIITSLWGRSALDNFSEVEMVTMAFTDYISHRRIRILFLGMEWEINNYKTINDKKFCWKEKIDYH